MTDAEPKPIAFFAGFGLLPRVICAIGACFFTASFFVQGYEGLGRAIGLFGLSLVFCGVAVNLISEIRSCDAEHHATRHLKVQSVLASFVAVALLCLAAYVYRHGTLPGFMPARYDRVK